MHTPMLSYVIDIILTSMHTLIRVISLFFITLTSMYTNV